jgi:hypothetical protein
MLVGCQIQDQTRRTALLQAVLVIGMQLQRHRRLYAHYNANFGRLFYRIYERTQRLGTATATTRAAEDDVIIWPREVPRTYEQHGHFRMILPFWQSELQQLAALG